MSCASRFGAVAIGDHLFENALLSLFGVATYALADLLREERWREEIKHEFFAT
jgi:hypothetical protein